uniref:AB hydrolase-1 domain-containing protein n=1 Tax=Grammatophora oceanica TaxID=210454 RepID=A0A7S1USR7_9STRA
MSSSREPSRYAKYNLDPLLGVATYPLGFHLLVLCGTELPLRIMMRNRGFQRLRVGRVQYYFHPGRQDRTPKRDRDSRSETGRLPIIFVHGIGVGLIAYMGIIDHFLESGRPILLPEIPYVSGFRPWQSPNAVLSPSVVTSTMVDMLATHGFFRGTFVGHSYGTVWLSYMVKYARQAVAAVCFLDPICFGLHYPRLTKQFVYVRPDPGSISYMVRTDVIVNWTIQRSFPWAWIILFAEQLEHIPCSVFLSESDMLVPAAKVEEYMRNHSFPIRDFEAADAAHFSDKAGINVAVFRGDCHGGWTERPSATSPKIAQCVEILTSRAEEWKES